MKSAYVVIAHGSRDRESSQAFDELLARFRKLDPKRWVEKAYLEIEKPDIPTTLESCISQGADQIFVIPLMVFPGRHVKEHIPAYIEDVKEKHPDVDFHYAGPLSEDPKLLEFLEAKTRK